ncbi:hypothetical protein Taro_015610 [Colocasia esculenta]|uniref:Secreted protein n=1 Tax=Colocasia esculenta TaxID=4460 RepID=A0A843ULP5_COLES|nr:hypothetical protein [Colocasia esculenta]
MTRCLCLCRTLHNIVLAFASTTGCLCLCRTFTNCRVCISIDNGAFMPPSDSMPRRMPFYDIGGLCNNNTGC